MIFATSCDIARTQKFVATDDVGANSASHGIAPLFELEDRHELFRNGPCNRGDPHTHPHRGDVTCYPSLNAIKVGLEVALPVVDLGARDHWTPKSDGIKVVLDLLHVASWVIGGLLVIGLSNQIAGKRR